MLVFPPGLISRISDGMFPSPSGRGARGEGGNSFMLLCYVFSIDLCAGHLDDLAPFAPLLAGEDERGGDLRCK
jgi:hypothetical protein